MNQPNRFQSAMRRAAKGLFGITFGVPGAETYEYALNWEKALPFGGTGGDITEPYRQHAPTAIAISLIAEDAASIEWQMFQGDAEEPTEDHPLLEWWGDPNPYMNGLQLWIGTYVIRQLFGEAFWYYPDVGKLETGMLPAMTNRAPLMLLDPRSVKHKVAKDGAITWALTQGTGEDMPLDGDHLTQFKRFNPYNIVRGLSKIESVIADLSGDHHAAQWNARFFGDQNGIPSGLIKPSVGAIADASTKAGRDQRNELLRTWNQKHAGTKRSVGILPAGWDWQDLGVSQKDMDYRGLREYGREQVLAAFGVPPFFAGVLDKANYANAREQKEVYWLGTITRFVKDIQATVNTDFLPKIGLDGFEVRPNWEQVKALTENLAEKTEIAGKWFAMGLPKAVINERLEMGWNEDDIEDADVGYLPFNVMPVSMVNAPPEPVPAALAEANDDEAEEPVEDEAKSIAGGTEARRALVWRNIIGRTRDLEYRFNKVVRRHYEEIRAEVLSTLDGLKGWQMAQGVIKEVGDLQLWHIENGKKKLQNATKPIHKASLARGGEALVAEAGMAISFDITTPLVVAKLTEMSHKITRIDDTIERLLSSTLSEGFAEAETLEQLRDRVSQVMDASLGRSMTIARTETGFAYNSGRISGMRQAGIDRHEWLSSRDADTRDSHWGVDGEVRGLGEHFSNGLEYPQDPGGPPEEVINCRCVSVPVVEG